MSSIDPLRSLVLELPPSCIQFWPLNPQFAVVGTYNLEKAADDEAGPKKTQQRSGSLILVQVAENDVKIIQTLRTPSAILDLHFAPRHLFPSLLGVATSTGSIDLYQLTDVDGKALAQILEPDDIPMVSHIRTLQYAPEDVLVTAFSWHPKDSRVGMSLSSGEILLASTTEGYSPEVMFTHELEAWTLAFLPGGQGFYSGGDDSVLGFSEIRGTREDRYRPSWADLKIHEAGVTAILPLQTNNDKHLVLTGSYDDHIRLLEIPAIGRRKVMAEMNLGGGVWRLKIVTRGNFEPSEPGDAPDNILLLASCMHAGARIVRLFRSGEDDWRFEVLAKFEKHKSMNYGSDCQPQVTEIGQHTFLTTSFYDRLLCLWRY